MNDRGIGHTYFEIEFSVKSYEHHDGDSDDYKIDKRIFLMVSGVPLSQQYKQKCSSEGLMECEIDYYAEDTQNSMNSSRRLSGR